MSELITVEGATLKFQDPTHSGTISILPASVLADPVKCQGAKAYKSIAFSVTGFSGGAVPSGGTGAGVIVGNSTKAKSQAAALVLADASVTIVITGTGSPPPTQSTTVEVDDPGQDKAAAV
jgi:hypothetical protein